MVHRFARDAEAWAELDRLLDEALDLPAPQRAGWIEYLTPRFEELKPRLRELLLRRLGARSRRFPEQAAAVRFRRRQWAPTWCSGRSARTRSGPIGWLRPLAEGGMGSGLACTSAPTGSAVVPSRSRIPGGYMATGRARRAARPRARDPRDPEPPEHRAVSTMRGSSRWPAVPGPGVRRGATPSTSTAGRRRLDLRRGCGCSCSTRAGRARARKPHRASRPEAARHPRRRRRHVRLLDFGIAKLLEHGTTRENQRATQMVGSASRPTRRTRADRGSTSNRGRCVCARRRAVRAPCRERPYQLERDSRAALEEAILHAEPVPPSEAALELRPAERCVATWTPSCTKR